MGLLNGIFHTYTIKQVLLTCIVNVLPTFKINFYLLYENFKEIDSIKYFSVISYFIIFIGRR